MSETKTLAEIMQYAYYLELVNNEMAYYASRGLLKPEKKVLSTLCWNALEGIEDMLKVARYYRDKLRENGIEPEAVYEVQEIVKNEELDTRA